MAKCEVISFKEQRQREKDRKTAKRTKRLIKAGNKQPQVPTVLPGNKDSGIPYHGKDRFNGQFRKMADRLEKQENGNYFLYYADNNKYNGDGTLKTL